ncbi:sensor histidine kinase [Paenibacillus sp. IHBB 3054]|uniref:sensor histidine kinase n=1 Tax=Paenibacillus sp. IHBB 3054 TaxID=3425689 RepID=UPI003F676B5C
MNFKWLRTVRLKFMGVVLLSLAATAAVLYIGYQFGSVLITIPLFKGGLAFIINKYGSTSIMYVTGPIIFLMAYFLLSRRIIRRIEHINDALQAMATGQLDQELESSSLDEIGQAARSLNEMARQLRLNVDKISSGVGEIASGGFSHRIEVEHNGLNEWNGVADSINQMAEQLDRSIQEERNAEKTKNDLITGVSHDLRTPLTSILGFLEVIENDRYQDEVELRHYISIAYEKSLTLNKLVEDLFEYTRINNGMPLHLEELDMVAFLRQLAEEFVPILEKAGMICRVSTDSERLFLKADGNLLVRGFENLISNAIRYGSNGGCIDITIHHSGEEALIRVINYGEPIPHKDLQFIFERFYRGDRSRSSGGTGLGLAIVKSIMEVHQGGISARSDRSETVFEARLPLKLK